MAVEQVRQLPRVLVRVVDAVEQDVLEGEALAGLQRFLELLARGEQLGERPALVDGHQAVAQLVGRRGERDGEVRALRRARQLAYLRDDARGRDRHAVR